MFGSYEEARKKVLSRRQWIMVVVCICLLIVAGYFLWMRLTHGLGALHSGMNKQDVIYALGEPNFSYSSRWDGVLPERTSLIYKVDAKTLLAVEFDQSGYITGRTYLSILGPLTAEQAYPLAALGALELNNRTKQFMFPGIHGRDEYFTVNEHCPY
jgi:hypothetical protein